MRVRIFAIGIDLKHRMNSTAKIAIIGPGKVGTAIGLLARRAGWPVVAVAGRNRRRTALAARAIGGGVRACTPAQAAAAADLILLTVPDGRIGGVCDALAARGALAKGAIVAHCCGALGSEVLASARRGGCPVASMHPLATFPTVRLAIELLAGTYCFIEGDRPAVAVLRRLARDIGCTPVAIAPSAKPLYHASAVVACNYLTAMMDAAVALARQAGIPRKVAWKSLEPLVRATLDNIARLGPEKALTGPIARGDAATIAGHLKAMEAVTADLKGLYKSLGRWTVGLARRKGTLTAAKARKIRKLLEK